jgi:geranylgeranyl transferase type-2 subunit alpha
MPLFRIVQEVLDMEPEAKWALLTLTRLREVQQQVLCESGTATAAEEASGLAAQVVEGYARLKELDPLRSGYYKDAEEGKAQVVARPMAASA